METAAHKRIGAFLIDVLIYVALWVFFYFNVHLGDYLSWLLASGYILVRDGLPHGQSIGKLMLKLRVVDEGTNTPISLLASVERNLILVLPNFLRFIPFVGSLLLILVYALETYLVYSHEEGRRWGDQFAKTRVVSIASP